MAILGGSSVYIPEFIVSLTSHNVHVGEIVLQGQPGKKLPLVAEFCQRLIDRSGFPTKVVHTTEVEEAVEGAKYVLNHVRVGGMQARVRDEKLPPKFGMVGDESLGAGGIANALRTLPVVLDYAARVEAVNPDCTFINLTNPMGSVVEALLKHTNLNVIGVCDLPGEFMRKIGGVLGRDCSELTFNYIGLNHMGWIQDVRNGTRSYMEEAIEKLADHSDDGFDADLIDLYRMIPTSTVGLFYHTDTILKAQKRMEKFRGEVLQETERNLLKIYKDKKRNELPNMSPKRNTPWYEETITPLISALEREEAQMLVLCVANAGAIRDLPDSCSVEVPVDVSASGLEPRTVGSWPRFLQGLVMDLKESERCTIEAVRHHSYELALQALVANPLVPSVDSAKAFLDRAIRDEGFALH